MQVRRAVLADQPALVPLVAAMHEHERLPMGPATEAALARLLADGAFGFVLVALDPEPVGYAVIGFGYSLEFSGRDAFVDELFVTPTARDVGIGARLLEAAEHGCREAGVAALHLEVDHANAAARRLYERTGYKAHERHLMTRWLGPGPASGP
ncbi:MAG: N-acetyltransferase family protein [Thermoplasmatota archaeon]|nr:GNAT family N-acetyltransferase [Halobacteriales archaeon]